jgi:DNA-binding NtrC family response regulator
VERGEPHRILVVDDDEAICEILQDYLATEGYHVECANDGAEARAILARDRFDAAVIDVVLRDERGLDLAEHAAGIGVPVILMSGHPEFMKSADDLPYLSLRKPFRLALVSDLLRALTASSRTRRGDGAEEERCAALSGS